jgi:hypothetical protein
VAAAAASAAAAVLAAVAVAVAAAFDCWRKTSCWSPHHHRQLLLQCSQAVHLPQLPAQVLPHLQQQLH